MPDRRSGTKKGVPHVPERGGGLQPRDRNKDGTWRKKRATRDPRRSPFPPCACTALSTMRKAASVAKSLAMEDCFVICSAPLSWSRAAEYTRSLAASSSVALSATMNCIA